jgi:hypothetical protein
MSIKNWNAGIIRPVAVAPDGPYQDGTASGVWTLDQVAYWQKQGLWPIAGSAEPVGLFAPIGTTSINKINIATTGNAVSFGNTLEDNTSKASCASNVRAVWAGGGGSQTIIQYVTFSAGGTATDFGDLLVGTQGFGGFSNNVRGIFAGGQSAGVASNVISYINIASDGNATDFGDLLQANENTPAACASSTRGVVAGGYTSGNRTNVIQYVTIASIGNATDFGDLLAATQQMAGAASDTRGIFGGGDTGTSTNVIQYITIASIGNATDFGDLIVATNKPGAAASSTRGVFAGGEAPSNTNRIQYVTIASTGNATDFGDLTGAKSAIAGSSSAAEAVQPTPALPAELGIFSGGRDSNGTSFIQYINIATAGNSIGFGDLFLAENTGGGCSSSTRSLTGGGIINGSYTSNVIQYIVFATQGKGLDFGDLTVGGFQVRACGNETRGLFMGRQDLSVSYNTIDYVTIASVGTPLTLATCFPTGRGALRLQILPVVCTRVILPARPRQTSSNTSPLLRQVMQ